MVVAQELGEVVEEDEEHAQRAALERGRGRRELTLREARVEEGEEAHEQLLHVRPAALVASEQQLGHQRGERADQRTHMF